jgi:DUF1009 family protein
MMQNVPDSLGLIAGKGMYPLLLAESARQAGVQRIFAVAFKGETSRRIEPLCDETVWLPVGQLQAFLEAFRRSGVQEAVMAGQITPTNLFRVRMDARARTMLKALPAWNAHTIFSAIGDALSENGVTLTSAARFMEHHLAPAGPLSARAPDEREAQDIRLGLQAARLTSGLEIGQTVVVKDGTILAVEAFEGTNATLRRGGKLGGPGAVLVKVAKAGHDMRFDIPVIGLHTLKVLRKIKATCIAVEAGRAILLEKEKVIEAADAAGMAFTAVPPETGAE